MKLRRKNVEILLILSEYVSRGSIHYLIVIIVPDDLKMNKTKNVKINREIYHRVAYLIRTQHGRRVINEKLLLSN